MVAKSGKFPGEYYRNNSETSQGLERSGSSGRIDKVMVASDNSSALPRNRFNSNFVKQGKLSIPKQVLCPSHILNSERKTLIRKLRLELEQVQKLRKKVELLGTNAVSVSSSSDIASCNNGANGTQAATLTKSVVISSVLGKGTDSSNLVHGLGRSASGKSDYAEQGLSSSAINKVLMKQCETLLKRLMSHQYGWVFNAPVDVVKLNIPDYSTIIKHPMDLGTIKKKIGLGVYSTPLEFHDDVRLTLKNAMVYNPPGNDVHFMADTLNKFFEVRWKPIEKKLPKVEAPFLREKSAPDEEMGIVIMSPSKRRKVTSFHDELVEPVKRIMTSDEKHTLGRELESLLGEMPAHIIEYLRKHGSSGSDAGDNEIEIDIEYLDNDTLFTLRKLLDDYTKEKQKKQVRVEPCEIELLNESGPSNSSMQYDKGNETDDEDVDIGGNEPPVSSFPPVDIKKDKGCRSSKTNSSNSSSDSDCGNSAESGCDEVNVSSPAMELKFPETLDSGAQLDNKATILHELDESVGDLEQLGQSSRLKQSSKKSDSCQDLESAPNERHVFPQNHYRAALLKKRFADTILKAREKTLIQDDKGDPEKLRRERKELELLNKKEKARIQAEAKAAEAAQKQAEAAAAAEARQKRELEREAARQALLEMEKTIEVNENSRFFEDLEMLTTAPCDHLPSSVGEISPDNSQDCLGGFKFGGSNPLEQLGLFMKEEEEDEEDEHFKDVVPGNDVEEGEID